MKRISVTLYSQFKKMTTQEMKRNEEDWGKMRLREEEHGI